MPFLVLKDLTATNVNGDSFTHRVGDVLSDWELNDFIKDKIKEGSAHYRALLEPISGDEAHRYRVKATAVEGDRLVDGEAVFAPWDDYVGLHPEEVVKRLQGSDSLDEVERVKRYERGGLNRPIILEYVAPAERPPFVGYEEMSVRDVLAKMEALPPDAVAEVVAYESAHRRRPAIVSYDSEDAAPTIAEQESDGEQPSVSVSEGPGPRTREVTV